MIYPLVNKDSYGQWLIHRFGSFNILVNVTSFHRFVKLPESNVPNAVNQMIG